jgi:predicted HAD superfamily phosphohydrolase YqeG
MSLFERLIHKYKKHGFAIIAVDVDHTLVNFKNLEESYEENRQLVRDLYNSGQYIIIWTGNEDIPLVKTFLAENNIPYHKLNEDAPFIYNTSRKLKYDILLDDKASIFCTYQILERFLNYIRWEK